MKEQEEINNDDTISTRTRAKLPKLDDMELLNSEYYFIFFFPNIFLISKPLLKISRG